MQDSESNDTDYGEVYNVENVIGTRCNALD